jgi:Tfp pilus assembly protein PilN
VKTRQVVVGLLPGCIDVVVYDGARRADSRRLPITPETDAAAWAKLVRRSAASLRSLVQEMNLTNCPATVLYRSPTQAVDLVDFAVRSPGQAVEAARLACLDSLPYSALSAVCEGAVIGRDVADAPRRTHVVVAAEREDIAEAIVHLIEEAGLKVLSVAPFDALVMAGFVSRAMREKAERRGRLYIGAHTSFFVITSAGSLLFSRRIDLGLESLAHSLTKPIWVAGRDEPIELDAETARQILHRHGIPDRGAIVHEAASLAGNQVIPLLQPVLQRFIVELRQSLRFGLNEEDRARLAIHVSGPGVAVPGLIKMIGDELVVRTSGEAVRHDPEHASPEAGRHGLDDALTDRRFLGQLNLLPRDVARRREVGRLRRWLWTGVAAALAVIAVDGWRYHARVIDARRAADALTAQIGDQQALQATADRLRTALGAMGELEGTIDAEVGALADYHALLQELSRITPRTIRFTTISFHRLSPQTMGTVSGYAFQGEDEGKKTDLQPFVQRLRESPLFEDIVLGNVAMGSIGTLNGQRFEATFTAVAVPASDEVDAHIAAAEGEATP